MTELLTGLPLLDTILACIWTPYRLVHGAFCSVTRIIRRGLSFHESAGKVATPAVTFPFTRIGALRRSQNPTGRLNSHLLVNHCLNGLITLKINKFPYHHYFYSVCFSSVCYLCVHPRWVGQLPAVTQFFRCPSRGSLQLSGESSPNFPKL